MKRFTQLSKKIKEIMDILMNKEEDNEHEAMFSKRHLGPQACASCEKNLVNMQGNAADHYAWKKLPFRDPSSSIARYGKGFSKILSYMQPSEQFSTMQHDHSSPLPVSAHRHHQSIDDSHLNLEHGQSNVTADPDQINTKNRTTYAGFYTHGKVKGDSKVYQRVSPNYQT